MKRTLASLLLSATLTVSALAPLPLAADDKQLSKADVEAIVKQFIKDNPDFVIKTLIDYQVHEQTARISEAAKNLSKMQGSIQNDPNSPVAGNPHGDVTIIEFFDYHCGYCKRFLPEVAQLIKEDKNVRFVFKEFPILSEDSGNAAKAALAVYSIDKSKYLDYHVLLMQTNDDFTDEVLTAKAKQLGIDPDQFHKAYKDPQIEKDLESNKKLAHDLDISGTPGLIVGSAIMPGAISYNKLKEAVQDARDSKNQIGGGEDKKDD